MNLTELIISKMMGKKAAASAENIPSEYAFERKIAWREQPFDQRMPAHWTPGGAQYGEFRDLSARTTKSLSRLRNEQAQDQAKYFAVPGSNVYNLIRKYLIEQGETNWHNFNNPKNPKPNPAVPRIKGKGGKPIDPEHIKAAGRTMVDNSSNNRFGNIG
jgi:hypothetical protein